MSDLAATQCGCDNNNSIFGRDNNSCLWLILLLFCCGNNNSWGRDNDGCGCNSIIWILILLSCCGGNSIF